MDAFRGNAAIALAAVLIASANCIIEQDFGDYYGPNPYTCSLNSHKVLVEMNDLREFHSSPPLQWNSALASSAMKEASKLKREGNCDLPLYYHDEQGTTYLSTSVRNFSEEMAVKFWYEGGQDYDYEKGGPINRNPNVQAFSQLVWRATREVGCAISCCDNERMILVCRYHPVGNIQGYYIQNVIQKLELSTDEYEGENQEL